MKDEMVLDMNSFDFNDIRDDDSNEPYVVEESVEDKEYDFSEDLKGDDDDWEDGIDPDVAKWMKKAEVEDDEDAEALKGVSQDFEKTFSTLSDDFEIAFGDTKVTKKELAEVVQAREEITKTKKTLSTFVSGIVAKEDVIQTSLTVAKTETELQLERVNQILDNPDDFNGDLKQVIAAKRTLTARMKDLEAKGTAAREALEAQREQATALAIQQTARSVDGGMKTIREVADFAKSQGVGHDIFLQHISPELVKLMKDAQRYNVAMEKNRERLNKTSKSKAPKSATAKRSTSSSSGKSEADAYKERIKRRMRNGEHVDATDSFWLLED